MNSPIGQMGALAIGTVEFVSPDEIKVVLDLNAPQSTALNAGVPSPFPRINGYILIPNETGAVVGLISWLGVEHSPFPKRTGLKDFGLIDLPFPLRKMSLTPIGTLILDNGAAGEGYRYRLERGVFAFPSVGDTALLPTTTQLRSVIEAGGANRRVKIGEAPLAANAVVSVDPDRIFGRHLAVLGNTGSGKSCTLAGIIRWSLLAADSERKANKRKGRPNARFIILDPNGEYEKAFADLGCRIFRVQPSAGDTAKPLTVPAWIWDSHEWSSFAGASPGSQRPMLMQALRDLRAGASLKQPAEHQAYRVMRSYKARLEQMIVQGVSAYTGFPASTGCGDLIANAAIDAERYAGLVKDGALVTALQNLQLEATKVAGSKFWANNGKKGYNSFSEASLHQTLAAIDAVLTLIPDSTSAGVATEDAPVPFDVKMVPDHLEQVAADSGLGQAAQWIAWLTLRIRMMLADRRLGPIVAPEGQPAFEEWLNDYVGESKAANGPIAILDLSLVPADILHVIIAVISRVVFEAVQRYRKLTGDELPTVLVLEEAHNFIQRGHAEEPGHISASTICRNTFERIAREGRKFGLGLVLSSQRPSELSPTVLAQCNTFILHRIVNDQDQELVRKLIPDNLGGLLRELPSLPSRQAILLGWATPVPVLVEITELAKDHCPRSNDPHFWDVWTGFQPRDVDWPAIVKDWTS